VIDRIFETCTHIDVVLIEKIGNLYRYPGYCYVTCTTRPNTHSARVLSSVYWLYDLRVVYFVIMDSGLPGTHVCALDSTYGLSPVQHSAPGQSERAPAQSFCFAIPGSVASSNPSPRQRRRANTLPWNQGPTFRLADGPVQQTAESSTAWPTPSLVDQNAGYPSLPLYNSERTGLERGTVALDNGSSQSVFLPENTTGYVAPLTLVLNIC
jgi:hypothetical protein